MNQIVFLVPALGIVALIYMFWRASWVTKQEAGDSKMQELAGYIADGAMAFLKAEWKILSYFAIIAAMLLAYSGTMKGTPEHPINSSPIIAIAFLIGAVFSATAGYIGMKIATRANVRTAHAAKTSLAKALSVSFTGGSVMGLGVAGLAVFGLSTLFIIFYHLFVPAGAHMNGEEMKKAIEVLAGFSLGAESIALFARVGGGIYTKAADVGADLVGKVEAGIPEDDPRNPATIADNVGDNVGDVAGMGADLFGSYVATILATMVLGQEIDASADKFGGLSPILLPMLIAGMGIVFSIIGTWFVKIKNETDSVQGALNKGNWSSIILTAIASYFLVNWLLPANLSIRGFAFTPTDVYLAIIVGLVVGTLMSIITEYFTAIGKRPVLSIVRQSSTGHATNIIAGLAVGMRSTALPMVILAGGIFASFHFAGLYGVAIAAAGMMATTAMQLAIDAFGPIADNAGGIAEMSQLPKEVRQRTDNLDAVGNTTAATGKGFAIASAALTSLALFAAFVGIAGISHIDIYKANVLAGLFVGAMIPFLFSSLAIAAVGRAAMSMVEEVRRQFREIPGIMEYKAKPEYEKCVAISTEASIREMIAPGAIALTVPLIVGFAFGPEVLGGLLAGVTVSGVLMGMFQSNAGGAWDNAKKSFEKGVEINGQVYYKGSEPHKASVTGDTVGDPFKDTSGPSMNILIKLMSIVSLIIAPHIANVGRGDVSENKTDATASTYVAADTTTYPDMDLISMKGMLLPDKEHSWVSFTIPHLLTSANGALTIDSGYIKVGDNLEHCSVFMRMSVTSIDTRFADRDNAIRGDEWFEVAKYPFIIFQSKTIKKSTGGKYKYVATGDLTIKDVTKQIDFAFNYVGNALNKFSNQQAHTFVGEFSINRQEYHVGGPNPLVGDVVKSGFSIEAYKSK